MKHFNQRKVGERMIRVSSPLTSFPHDFIPSPMAKNYDNTAASKLPTLKNQQSNIKEQKLNGSNTTQEHDDD